MATLIHARALHDRYHSAGISTYSVQPGIVATNLQADGARTTLFCATSPKAENYSGGCFVPYGKLDKRPDKWYLDEELVGRLWTESERMVREAGF